MSNVTARSGNVASNVNVKRPSWDRVYVAYPKTEYGIDFEDDLPATVIFTSILGSGYDAHKFSNACATRISLALLSGEMENVTKQSVLQKQLINTMVVLLDQDLII